MADQNPTTKDWPAVRMFPILWGYRLKEQAEELRVAGSPYLPVCMPWEMLAPHEKQAQRNHSQTLQRLADRGGLDVTEALAVLEDREWRKISLPDACEKLCRRIAEWVDQEIERAEAK